MTSLDIERTELREFTAGVRADAARSLELLRAIESTLTWTERLTESLRVDALFAEKANDALASMKGIIDPDDSLQSALEEAQGEVNSLYQLLLKKRQAGRNDRQLTEDDGIETAYTEAIAHAADLHNAINALRWNIGEHDINAAPRRLSRAYSADNLDNLFDSLIAK